MLNELLLYTRFLRCPLCGRYHDVPMEYYWCPYCGSDLQKQINELKDKVSNLEEYLKELDKEELID